MQESNPTTNVAVSSPPPAERPAAMPPDPAARLHELARELVRSRNRRLMMEFLRLRRALR
jgi:hypothetical protein